MAGNVAIIGCTVALKVAPCVQGVHDYTQSIMDYTARTSACIHVQAIIVPQLARSKSGSESRDLNHSQIESGFKSEFESGSESWGSS